MGVTRAAVALALLLAPLAALPGSSLPSTSSADAADPPRLVLWDPRGGVLDGGDVGFAGSSAAAAQLLERGHGFAMATMPVREVLAWVRPGDALALGLGSGVRYTPQDIEALVGFVAGGGGLLVFGEHDGFLDTPAHQNPLLERFGMRFLHAGVEDERSEALERHWIIADAPAWGVQEAVLVWPAPIELLGNGARAVVRASPQANIPEAVLVAEADHGAGRVVAVADVEWLWNGSPSIYGLPRRNTSLLWDAVAGRLLGPAHDETLLAPARTLLTGAEVVVEARVAHGASAVLAGSDGLRAQPLPAPPGLARWAVQAERDGWLALEATRGAARDRDVVRVLAPPAVEQGRAALLLDGLARAPDGGPGGTLALARTLRDAGLRVDAGLAADLDLTASDVAAWVAPLRPAPDVLAAARQHAHLRWLVAAEPWASVGCASSICAQLRGYGAVDPPRPLDALGAHLGVGLPDGFVAGAGAAQSPVLRWAADGQAGAWRAAPLRALREDLAPWAAALDQDWWERTGLTLQELTSEPVFALGEDARLPRAALARDGALVAGDADPWTNAVAAHPARDLAARWAAPLRLDLAAPGAVDAGGRFPVRAAGPPEALRVDVVLPHGVAVVEAGGAAVEAVPGGTRLRWSGPGPHALVAEAPLQDAWLLLQGMAALPGGAVHAEAPVRLAAPRLALAVAMPAASPVAGDVVLRAAVHNVGDAPAGKVGAVLALPLPYAPEPGFADPPGVGEPGGEAEVGPKGWRIAWHLPPLAPEGRATIALALHAPALPGAYALALDASAAHRYGLATSAAASWTHRVG